MHVLEFLARHNAEHPCRIHRVTSMKSLLVSLAVLAVSLLPAASAEMATSAAMQVGVAHIGGLYSFSDSDYLNEGATAALSLGARCIKMSLSLDTEKTDVSRLSLSFPVAEG